MQLVVEWWSGARLVLGWGGGEGDGHGLWAGFGGRVGGWARDSRSSESSPLALAVAGLPAWRRGPWGGADRGSEVDPWTGSNGPLASGPTWRWNGGRARARASDAPREPVTGASARGWEAVGIFCGGGRGKASCHLATRHVWSEHVGAWEPREVTPS